MKGAARIFLAQHLWLNPAVTSPRPSPLSESTRSILVSPERYCCGGGPITSPSTTTPMCRILRHHYRARLETRATETTVFSWFKPNRQREKIREDRKHLEARARRLLKGYLSADAPRKQRYYEVIAGAAAACQPGVSDPNLENAQLAQAAAEAALKVVKLREHQAIADNDQVAALITDAYATVAIAYRRASAAYTVDEEMQKLGTAAVHLLTIATSYMAAQSAETTPRDDSIG